MGLLTIIRKQKIRDKEVRCLVLGLDNAGKSSVVDWVLWSCTGKIRSEVTPTIGFRIHTVPFAARNVQLWDIGGQSTLRPYWDNYFDKTDVLLWVIDATAPRRVDESIAELTNLLRDRDRIGYNCRIIVLLNKVDLVSDAADLAASLEQQLQDMLRLSNIPLSMRPTSTVTGQGLEGLMPEVVADALAVPEPRDHHATTATASST
ncbi:LAMI_0G16468g1_1 [Lachancea mirantina]|uniref:LAMI_0G16468g1_1 n=1 Tax=Lachancea mirantina TaxID=1230905 RepID=A0A1G4KCP9_9SACH|nr:LAMI_0G16468g1_1 [Lachancea mirantina]